MDFMWREEFLIKVSGRKLLENFLGFGEIMLAQILPRPALRWENEKKWVKKHIMQHLMQTFLSVLH